MEKLTYVGSISVEHFVTLKLKEQEEERRKKNLDAVKKSQRKKKITLDHRDREYQEEFEKNEALKKRVAQLELKIETFKNLYLETIRNGSWK